MKVWAGFFVLSFLLAGRAARHDKAERWWVVLLGSAAAGAALYSLRLS